MKLTTAFATALIMVLLGVLSQVTRAADPASASDDIPHRPPTSSTAFVCELPEKKQIVAVVVAYGDGSTVRFDAQNMHGFNVKQLMLYHDAAPDSRIYIVSCRTPEIT